jgi:hypothetical protein
MTTAKGADGAVVASRRGLVVDGALAAGLAAFLMLGIYFA